jgi:hypothetical protein
MAEKALRPPCADGRESFETPLGRVDYDDRLVVDRHHLTLTDGEVDSCTCLDATASASRCPLWRPQITDDRSEYPSQSGHDRESK